MKKIKINAMELSNPQMNGLRGGKFCTCSCYWAETNGITIEANRQANYDLGSNGGESLHGCNQYIQDDNGAYPCNAGCYE